jgi:DNA processing protein
VNELSGTLATRSYIIVSGLANGIDTAAHEGALDANEDTIAILPGSVENIYPKSNTELADEIARNGALVSELSKFGSMHRGRYLERNRITSGISDAIVVGASRETGGTIKQIKKAKAQGVPRFYYNPSQDDGQSPKKLEQLGCVPFSDKGELLELIQDRESIFETSTTKRATLDEF